MIDDRRPITIRIEGDTASLEADLQPRPGQKCPTCNRRVNHPRKDSSPQTRTISYRLPTDEYEAHEDVAETAARFIGVHERPHWRYLLNTYAYAAVLQDESMRGVANRSHE